MSLVTLRSEIDRVDDNMAALLAKRMELAADVAREKMQSGGPVHQRTREQEILERLSKGMEPQWQPALRLMYTTLFQASRSCQHGMLAEAEDSALRQNITAAADRGLAGFPATANVACQGIEGAYSHIAARAFFDEPKVIFLRTFDAVFRAVEQGLCRYGVLPIENSSYGSVTAVYDLLKEHNCSIVKAVRLPIAHCLLSRAKYLSEIKEIYSHEQALRQCGAFLDHLGSRVEVIVCENTAVAARMAAQSERTDVAAISSEECAALYGLNIIKQDIQNEPRNETRFICIARQGEIYPGANKSSVLLSLRHRPGSLAALLQLLAAMNVNLTKLENRPAPGREFEVMFYLDMECDASQPETVRILEEMARQSESFLFLGSYAEGDA